VYAIAAEATRGLIHLKTAGTSYLEALRVLASTDPAFFREILQFAIDRYETDKASYHVSASLDRVPRPKTLTNADLPGLLEQFDSREALHVTFGSVLTSERGYKARLLGNLAANEERYYDALERHFIRHLAPLSRRG
jgi:tagaturonate epimerase